MEEVAVGRPHRTVAGNCAQGLSSVNSASCRAPYSGTAAASPSLYQLTSWFEDLFLVGWLQIKFSNFLGIFVGHLISFE